MTDSVAGELLVFRCPPGEGECLVSILERGQRKSELRTTANWLHLVAPKLTGSGY